MEPNARKQKRLRYLSTSFGRSRDQTPDGTKYQKAPLAVEGLHTRGKIVIQVAK